MQFYDSFQSKKKNLITENYTCMASGVQCDHELVSSEIRMHVQKPESW